MPDTPDSNPYDSIVSAASAPRVTNYDPIIEKHAARTGVDPNLIRAVIGQESSGNRTAVSPKGARGLMQLMPATAQRFGVRDVNDPDQNIGAGASYLKFLSDRYGGDVDKTIAAYNAGEGNVDKYGGIPPFKETRNYVPAVKARYQKLTGQQPQSKDPYDAIVNAANGQSTPEQSSPYDSVVAASTPQGRGAANVATQPKPSRRVDTGWGTGSIGSGVKPSKSIVQPQVSGEATYSDADKVRNAVRASAPPGFGLLPDAAQEAIGEQIAKGASGVSRLASGAIKVAPRAGTLGIPNALEQAVAPVTQPVRQALNQATTTAASGAGEMEKQANRPTINVPVLGKVGMQDVYNVGGGAASSAPAMVLTSLGVPAPVAFGVQSYLESEGRDADWKDVLKETGVGASTGALFEIPLPARMALLAKIGAKLGIVGGGTYGIEKLAGMPEAEARKNAFTNALFAASGAGKESPEESVKPTQTVPDELQGKLRGSEIDSALAAREAKVRPATQPEQVPAMRVADQVQGAQPIDLAQSKYPESKYPENLGVVGPTKPVEPSADIESAPLNRWQHRNFGLVTETADQSGVTSGRVRVIDEDGNEHIIQRSNGRGEGNNIAVPVKPKVDARAQDEAAQAAENAPFKVIDRRGNANSNTEGDVSYIQPNNAQVNDLRATSEAPPKEVSRPALEPTERTASESAQTPETLRPQPQSVAPRETAPELKGDANAVRVESASGMDVRQQTTNGKALGEGNTINQVPPKTETDSEQGALGTRDTEGESKVSGLARGVEAKAIQSKLTQGFEGLPEYSMVKVADQAARAIKLLDSNPEQARRIAMGTEHPPDGLLPESVFTAVENRALQQGDVDTIRDLATKSTRSMEATGMGQRIRMLAERNPDSPVSAIQQVEKARGAKVSDSQLADAAKKVKTEVQVETKKTVPKAEAWSNFLESIKC